MSENSTGSVIEGLTAYIANALRSDLPPEVAAKAKHHLLDTISSMISGAHMAPGQVAVRYAASQGGPNEALIAGSNVIVSAVNAALANGMTAHADETDDSHFASRSHLGCAVVPAALAMAEREGCNGDALLKAVVLGYDIGGRLTTALGGDRFYEAGHSTHSFAPLFGAAAAAGALAGLSEQQLRWMISYTAQQASGVNCWQRDADHIEKAFDFGGMAARNAIAAATMVQAGFTGLDDVFTGERNFFFAYAPDDAQPAALLDALGARYEIMHTNIKKWTVGSPIQAVLDSVQAILGENDLVPEDIAEIVIRMSDKESHVVDNRHMAEINLQYLTAVMVLDRTVTFASAHDDARMEAADIQNIKQRIQLIPDANLPRRQPVIEIKTATGQLFSHRTSAVRGTPENPMSQKEVGDKAFDLVADPLGADKARALIERIWTIETVRNTRDLRELMTP
ncbi:MAG: MmgE/PrpD family protein [Alphaproteobacteria bacterium]|nr:MmgE/PrpD family protein [Alphaproteobacteria bacterium]